MHESKTFEDRGDGLLEQVLYLGVCSGEEQAVQHANETGQEIVSIERTDNSVRVVFKDE